LKVLVLGDGLLGSELVKQTGWDYISRKKDNIDFTKIETYANHLQHYEIIVNCIGYVDTYSKDKQKHWDINYKGVADLIDICNNGYHEWYKYRKNLKLVQISTDYVYANSVTNASEDDVPVHSRNWYGYTKLLCDGYVQLKCRNHLLIRTSFKKEPFSHSKGWMIKGNFDYTSVIAEKIVELVKLKSSGIYNVGTDLKTLYDLGKQTNSDIEPTTEYIDESVPDDVSMNLEKLEKVL